MREYCDLHVHSVYSDGTCTPRQILEEARKLGLGAVALTDHNTLAGIPEFLEIAESTGVRAVPGVEISTAWKDKELHIVALLRDTGCVPALTALLEKTRQDKADCMGHLVEALEADVYLLDRSVLQVSHAGGSINRAHIAAELLRRGYVQSAGQAFDTILSPEGKYYKPPQRLDALQTVVYLKQLGCVAVLAHPLVSLSPGELEAFLEGGRAAGLDAMETRYSSYSPEQETLCGTLARRFALKESGGSDFHGSNKPDIRLAMGRGGLRVPLEFLEKLMQ